MRIGVFDSGIGGLTVLKALMSKYPNNEYIYYGDTKNIPYGDKTVEELKLLSSNIIDFLISKKVDMIVIACGTVSSNLSSYLKNKYDIKIVDIISPTIDYINNSEYNKIGVIATKATINSKIFSTRLNKNVKEVASPMFVPIIEKRSNESLEKYIKEYLKELKDRELIILGCTHYPLIKDEIQSYLGNNIKLLDMSDCINSIKDGNKHSLELYFSKIDNNLINNISNILQKECKVNKINE